MNCLSKSLERKLLKDAIFLIIPPITPSWIISYPWKGKHRRFRESQFSWKWGKKDCLPKGHVLGILCKCRTLPDPYSNLQMQWVKVTRREGSEGWSCASLNPQTDDNTCQPHCNLASTGSPMHSSRENKTESLSLAWVRGETGTKISKIIKNNCALKNISNMAIESNLRSHI